MHLSEEEGKSWLGGWPAKGGSGVWELVQLDDGERGSEPQEV